MRELSLQTGELAGQVSNNKHTDLTATYYLLLQQWLRQKDVTLIGYYASKDALINRHRVVEKAKEMYEKRLIVRLEELSRSRKNRGGKSERKKGSKTSEKKKTGL
jgi:hypothetical protein